MQDMFMVICAASWSDNDLQRLRNYRKDKARAEQAADTKEERRDCQKHIKAATMLLDYFDGKRASRSFPAELAPYIRAAAARL
jgi:hypothetical protein